MQETRFTELGNTVVWEEAATLAGAGLAILPLYSTDGQVCSCGKKDCKSPGKHPVWELVPNGVKDATTDIDQIMRWFVQYPAKLNVGVRGGGGFVIVDWDDRESYHAWAKANPALSHTLTVETPGRGFHTYFALEEGYEDITWYDHGKGEVRGRDAYVVAPPSIHHSGGTYRWVDASSPILAIHPSQLPPRKEKVEALPVVWDGEKVKVDVYSMGLSKDTLRRLHKPDLDTDRSQQDYIIVMELLKAAATPAQIFTIYETMAIGGPGTKYGDKHHHARSYLALTIGKAQAVIEAERAKIKQAAINLGAVTDAQKEAIAKLPADDDGNARAVKILFGDGIMYNASHKWMIWNGRFWQTADAEAKVRELVTRGMRIRQMVAVTHLSGTEQGRVLKSARADEKPVTSTMKMLIPHVVNSDVNQLNSDPDLLNVANGVLNLKTGVLTPHSPEAYFSYILDTEYDPEADQSVWVSFLRETLRNERRGVVGAVLEDLMQWLQEAVGYILTGHTREEVFFYIYGPPRAGKGVFTETLLTLLGRPLSHETNFSTFRAGGERPFALAHLQPARLVAASESGTYDWLNEELLKRMTGGNWIQAEKKYGDPFSFRPKWKVVLSSNETPKADPDSRAIWGRARVIEFPNSHLGTEDKTLKARMRSNPVLRGVLAWAVEGARRWYLRDNMGLESPVVIKEATERFREELDFVAQWVAESVVPGKEEFFMPTTDMYNSYLHWVRRQGESGLKPLSQQGLARVLTNKGFDSARVYIEEGDRRIQKRGYRGIKKLLNGNQEVQAHHVPA